MALTITDSLLIKLAGKAAYQRGRNYFESGAVLEWTQKKNVITANVNGTHIYLVRLELTDTMLEGGCDCPASENFDFCKHCVAVALAYADQTTKLESLSQGNSREQIQAHLLSMDKKSLEHNLLDLICQDTVLMGKWLMKSQAALGNLDVRSIKKQITKALPYRQLWGRREVAAYFHVAEIQLEEIIEQANQLDASDAVKLMDYAYQRLNKSLERIDDSDGARFYLESILEKCITTHFQTLPWDDQKKADFLLEKLIHSHDIYPQIPAAFVCDTNSPVLKRLLEAANTLWDSWPALDEDSEENSYSYWPLKHLLLEQARKTDDLAQQIAINSKVATQFFNFTELCQLNMDYGDLESAYYWLSRAEKAQRFSQNKTCEHLKVQLLIHEKKYQHALKLQWSVFTCSRLHKDYKLLLMLYKKLNRPQQDCYDKTEAYLLDQSNKQTNDSTNNSQFFANRILSLGKEL